MRFIARGLTNAALLLSLSAAGTGANAAITLSSPEFLPGDADTFDLMVSLDAPFGSPLDALELVVQFDDSNFDLTQVVKQPGVPGNFETVTPKFGSISYPLAATISSGPLFKLTFDVKPPVDPTESITVTVIGRPTFVEEELEPITLTQSITLIPEPSTYALFGIGMVAFAAIRLARLA